MDFLKSPEAAWEPRAPDPRRKELGVPNLLGSGLGLGSVWGLGGGGGDSLDERRTWWPSAL